MKEDEGCRLETCWDDNLRGPCIMKADRTCKYCKETFANIEGRVFSNHVRWCDKNLSRNKSNTALSESMLAYFDSTKGKFKKFEVECETCGKPFEVKEREKLFPKKEKYFCSKSCSCSNMHSDETKLKQSVGQAKVCYIKYCRICKKVIRAKYTFCSNKCVGKHYIEVNNINLSAKEKYRKACKFKFNLKDFPEEYDFSLMKKCGWWNPVTNIEGVSRDHIVSVQYGYENDVDPEIINHPANCQIIKQRDNSNKHIKCHMTIQELLQKIKNWNIKYRVVNSVDRVPCS